MRINDIVMKLLIEQPFYGYVASSISFVESDNIETIKMASIPNQIITYNPVWFNRMSTQHQIGVVLHELLHVILLHQYRRNNREIILWSVACDMAVNELLSDHYIPEDAITTQRMSVKLKNTIERQKNAEYYYEIINDGDEFASLLTMEGDNILISDSKMQFKVQKLSQDNVSSMEVSAFKSNLAQTFSDAKTEGVIPSSLEEGLNEVVIDIRIDWRVMLKRFLTGRGKMIIRKSYKRQSRRYEQLPGTKRSVGVNALIAIDESGSVSDVLVKQFYHELTEINKITGTSMLVTKFDTQCTEPVSLSTFVSDSRREKRGGTDFRPVFKLADELKIPLVIIFTDGDGEAPTAVNQNTLWVLTKNAKKPASYGYMINFEG
jgi:predicted metal-dependent peptidase